MWKKKNTSTAPSTKCGCSWQPVDSKSVKPESLLTQCSHSGGDLEGQDVYKAMLTCWRLLSCMHTCLYTHVLLEKCPTGAERKLFSQLDTSGMVRGLEPEGRQVGISSNDYKLLNRMHLCVSRTHPLKYVEKTVDQCHSFLFFGGGGVSLSEHHLLKSIIHCPYFTSGDVTGCKLEYFTRSSQMSLPQSLTCDTPHLP